MFSLRQVMSVTVAHLIMQGAYIVPKERKIWQPSAANASILIYPMEKVLMSFDQLSLSLSLYCIVNKIAVTMALL